MSTPTTPGYYWFQGFYRCLVTNEIHYLPPEIVHVSIWMRRKQPILVAVGSQWSQKVSDLKAKHNKWSGPIPCPFEEVK